MDEKPALAGKTVLLTGASMGLGRRMALTLAGAGARVAVTARSLDKLETLAREIAAAGGQAAPFALDVRDGAAIAAVLEAVTGQCGEIDVLINNAGVSVGKRPEDFTVEDYDFIMETNLKGAWLLAQGVGRRMIARGRGGKIVNIASLLALKALGQLSLYGMSKAALAQMTRQLALEWARHDIQVNAICPGYIETEMNRDHWATPAGRKLVARLPRQRIGTPDALDAMIVLLSSAQSDFISGAVIPVDDAQSLM
jgi:NAD(P)-dependent dehydrogenase (short-subunit alcohol dehydrogenase family)